MATPKVSVVSNYGIIAHYMLNLRHVLSFELAPNMQIACIELCIYVISKSALNGRGRTSVDSSQWPVSQIPYGK